MTGPASALRADRLPVRVRAWGATDAEVDEALRRAGRGWGRGGWEFADVKRLTGAPCPLDVHDRTALAAEQGYDWAYVVHRGGE